MTKKGKKGAAADGPQKVAPVEAPAEYVVV